MKPVVDGLQQGYGDRVDFVIYADLTQDPAASEFASGQGVDAVPTTVLVAPDGKELKRWLGAQRADELHAELDDALFSVAK